MGALLPDNFFLINSKTKMSLSQRFFSEAFRDMQRAMTAFDQSFYNTARRSVIGSPSSLLNQNVFSGHLFRYPAADMVETSDSYELSAELPGYDKKNIKIELADNSRTLILSGSSENEVQKEEAPIAAEAKEKAAEESAVTEAKEVDEKQEVVKAKDTTQYLVKERVSGSFSRSFTFPNPIDPDTIKASFENGVLKVTIPKPTEAQVKKINIE